MMRMSPSERNAEDIRRLKARAARRGLSPGPGAYSPQDANKTSLKLSGHAAFRSSSDRIVSNLLKDKGDPGSYEPQIYLSLVRQASTSWNKSASGECAPRRHERLPRPCLTRDATRACWPRLSPTARPCDGRGQDCLWRDRGAESRL